jgi:acyl-CoA synthetase (AMP-forming)/AMP-acid ligase II
VTPDAGDPRLVAFVIGRNGAVGDDEALDPRRLRAELSAVLPQNMVPQDFLQVPAFPLNPNGKVDRKVLAHAAQSDGAAVGASH